MCEWCENGRLIRKLPHADGGGKTKTKDYSEWLHKPGGYVPSHWDYQHQKALRILEVEKKKAPASVSIDELEEHKQRLRDQKEARAEQCVEDGKYKCLCCSGVISRQTALRGGFCNRCYQRVKRWEKKKRLVEKFGGECSRCGLASEYVGVYDFHHRNPEEKSFNIGEQINRAQDILYKELEKCDLLCANCHREVEHGFDEEVFHLFLDRM